MRTRLAATSLLAALSLTACSSGPLARSIPEPKLAKPAPSTAAVFALAPAGAYRISLTETLEGFSVARTEAEIDPSDCSYRVRLVSLMRVTQEDDPDGLAPGTVTSMTVGEILARDGQAWYRSTDVEAAAAAAMMKDVDEAVGYEELPAAPGDPAWQHGPEAAVRLSFPAAAQLSFVPAEIPFGYCDALERLASTMGALTPLGELRPEAAALRTREMEEDSTTALAAIGSSIDRELLASDVEVGRVRHVGQYEASRISVRSRHDQWHALRATGVRPTRDAVELAVAAYDQLILPLRVEAIVEDERLTRVEVRSPATPREGFQGVMEIEPLQRVEVRVPRNAAPAPAPSIWDPEDTY